MSIQVSMAAGFDVNPKNDSRGEYNPYINQIILFKNNIEDVATLANVVIHEYVHSTQKLTDYAAKHSRYGYYNNPYETEAQATADKYYLECVEDVLN